MQVLKEAESHGLLILEKYSQWKMTEKHHYQVSANVGVFQSILHYIKLLRVTSIQRFLLFSGYQKLHLPENLTLDVLSKTFFFYGSVRYHSHTLLTAEK